MTLQQVFLCLGLGFIAVSFRYHFLNKETLSVVFLLGAAFLFFFFSANVYPFINVWDERFHALVAKNLMNHPLMPTLYDEKVIDMAYDRWDRYHIWLHKQPLFLWQIALSFKALGVNELSLRLPSVILSVCFVFAAYRSGKILGNRNTGLYTAALVISSSYLFKLVSGGIELDQNDVSFISYISLSIWAWLEYNHSKKIIWLICIGVFSGFAVLCKWLVGLLIYLIWGIYSGLENKFTIGRYRDILLSFFITLIVFLPWQVLTLSWFPAEAKYSFLLNSKHFSEAVDGHEGPFYYHFLKMSEIFGFLIPYLLIPALIFFCKKCINKNMALAMTGAILFVYIFFALAVTKMPSFTAVLILPIYLSMAFLFDFLLEKAQNLYNKKYLRAVFLSLFFILLVIRMDFFTLFKYNSFHADDSDKGYRNALSHNKAVFTRLNLSPNTVLFNVKGRHYVEAMFYTGLPAYNTIPTEKDYSELRAKGRQIAIFRNEDFVLPDYIPKGNVIVLTDTVFVCE